MNNQLVWLVEVRVPVN